ncbi:MAG: TadE/TadG family type IV pilus assembly protein, partial [Brachybacterium sp.]|nr:TadE/TadG family type IV pilus assembly protein [Brachybacterium sp.]
DDGSAVVEFPLVAVLVVLIALLVIQTAVVLHTRNTLTDAAVQGAHSASVLGNGPDDGAARAEQLIAERLGGGYEAGAVARQDADGRITVEVTATLPLIGLIGPHGTLQVRGHAIAEESR